MQNRRVWALKSVSDEDRSYISIEGYNDQLNEKYVYDNFVPNHKQIREGDLGIIIDKETILGFAKINSITAQPSRKSRNRCAICESTNFEARKKKKPLYKCNEGHEFENYRTEVVDSMTYIANYGSSFILPDKTLSISSLRPYYANNYNRNMSIQLLDFAFLDSYFPKIVQELSSDSTYLSAYEVLDQVGESKQTDTDNYIPGIEDEREKVLRQINERRGQKKFGDSLRKRYGDQCMVTGCRLPDILEAAHIRPYRSEKDNHPSNGLLLRADIHTLYDLNLIKIDPETLMIHIDRSALSDGYEIYHQKTLWNCIKERPSIDALKLRWEQG